jgi:DNA-binding response OmpR family regulator
VLVVEDDAEMRALIREALLGAGYEPVTVPDGRSADEFLRRDQADAVILDVWLPDADGVRLCRQWREDGLRLPLLMVTARTEVSARVAGLDAGADDYLGKPFAVAELRARLAALFRRGARSLRGEVLRKGRVTVDFGRRQAWVAGHEVPITRRELDVLERLTEAEGRAVSRDEILEDLWGEATPEAAASLEVIVARLRRKLEREGRTPLIRTLRGFGYAVAWEEDAS